MCVPVNQIGEIPLSHAYNAEACFLLPLCFSLGNLNYVI